MKKYIKQFVCVILSISMCYGLAGCSKNARECKANGKAFMAAALECDFDEMCDYCDDEAQSYVRGTRDMHEGTYRNISRDLINVLEDILSEGKVKVDSVDEGSNRITVTYVVTIPDPDEILDAVQDGSDIDDAIDEVSDTADYEVELEFVNRHDEWLIADIEEYADFYVEIYSDATDIVVAAASSTGNHNAAVQEVIDRIG